MITTVLATCWGIGTLDAANSNQKNILVVDPNGDPKETYASIQAAIDKAADGNTILVSAGTYRENLDYGAKKIIVESMNGPGQTIIQAVQKNSVAIINGGTIRGFVLTGGTGRPYRSSYGHDYYGGGILMKDGGVVENCIITGNGHGTPRQNSGTFGGGVSHRGGQGVIRNSVLHNNFAWACGGAVLTENNAVLTLENCTVTANGSTNFFGFQGGLGMANGGKLVIRNCIVWGNSGDEIGAFSGIYARGTKATVSHSLIEGGFKGEGNQKVGNVFFVAPNNVNGPDQLYGTRDDGLRLQEKSPAIDKAAALDSLGEVDLAGFLRVQGSGLDIGAYEFGDEEVSHTKKPPPVGAPGFSPKHPDSDYQKKLEVAEKRIRALEASLTQKDLLVAQRDEQIAVLGKQLKAKDDSLATLNERLNSCRAECEQLKVKIIALEKELAGREHILISLNASENRVRDLEEEQANMRNVVAEAERKLLVPHTTDWYFIDGKGWLWANPDYYPLVYSQQMSGWLYYEVGTHGPWLYYDYKTEKWLEW